MLQQDMIDTLEEMVDASDLVSVVLALARMCNEKAEHLRENWQDRNAARSWDKDASLLDKLSTKLEN